MVLKILYTINETETILLINILNICLKWTKVSTNDISNKGTETEII